MQRTVLAACGFGCWEIRAARIPRILTRQLTVRHIITPITMQAVLIMVDVMAAVITAGDLTAAVVGIIDLDMSRLPNHALQRL